MPHNCPTHCPSGRLPWLADLIFTLVIVAAVASLAQHAVSVVDAVMSRVVVTAASVVGVVAIVIALRVLVVKMLNRRALRLHRAEIERVTRAQIPSANVDCQLSVDSAGPVRIASARVAALPQSAPSPIAADTLVGDMRDMKESA